MIDSRTFPTRRSRPRRLTRTRRGGALLWTVAALALAVALTPVFVGLCRALSQATARGGYRLIATRAGTREMDRLRYGTVTARNFGLPELPAGRCEIKVAPAEGGLKRVDMTITWSERGATGRAEWTTLVREGAQR